MNDKASGSEKAFLDRQHARLLKLHAEISRTIEAEEAEESEVQAAITRRRPGSRR